MKFDKLPITVEAIQWTGKNTAEVKAWMHTQFVKDEEATSTQSIALFVKRRQSGMSKTLFSNVLEDPTDDVTAALWVAANDAYLGITDGEWIIKDQFGFYPCKTNDDNTAPHNYKPHEETA